MSDFQAYDGNKELWVDLRTCSNAELFGWADSSMEHGDDVVLRDCVTLLNERGVPHSFNPPDPLKDIDWTGPATEIRDALVKLWFERHPGADRDSGLSLGDAEAWADVMFERHAK